MPSFSFPSTDNLTPRFSEITSGPQQRIYSRPIWDLIPLPLFEGQGIVWNDDGTIALTPESAVFYPTTDTDLAIGDFWNNGLAIAIVGPTAPNPSAAPVFFSQVTAISLLIMGGKNLPIVLPGAVGQLWNNGGELSAVQP